MNALAFFQPFLTALASSFISLRLSIILLSLAIFDIIEPYIFALVQLKILVYLSALGII